MKEKFWLMTYVQLILDIEQIHQFVVGDDKE